MQLRTQSVPELLPDAVRCAVKAGPCTISLSVKEERNSPGGDQRQEVQIVWYIVVIRNHGACISSDSPSCMCHNALHFSKQALIHCQQGHIG